MTTMTGSDRISTGTTTTITAIGAAAHRIMIGTIINQSGHRGADIL